MQKKTVDYLVIGNGGTTLAMAFRLLQLGHSVQILNPDPFFHGKDLRPASGNTLWHHALKQSSTQSLQKIFELFLKTVREFFPFSIDLAQFLLTDSWSVLSKTPVHSKSSAALENEFFKIEKRNWNAQWFRLLDPNYVSSFLDKNKIHLHQISNIDSVFFKSHALHWNASEILKHYLEYFLALARENDLQFKIYFDAALKERYGKKLIFSHQEGNERKVTSLKVNKKILLSFCGNLLPKVKNIVAACSETWIQGVRKRRKERQFLWFEKGPSPLKLWIELGQSSTFFNESTAYVTWATKKGPDDLDRILDESLRICGRDTQLIQTDRSFFLEWEWKSAQWRETSHDTYWATAHEGDLWSILDILSNIPQ